MRVSVVRLCVRFRSQIVDLRCSFEFFLLVIDQNFPLTNIRINVFKILRTNVRCSHVTVLFLFSNAFPARYLPDVTKQIAKTRVRFLRFFSPCFLGLSRVRGSRCYIINLAKVFAKGIRIFSPNGSIYYAR